MNSRAPIGKIATAITVIIRLRLFINTLCVSRIVFAERDIDEIYVLSAILSALAMHSPLAMKLPESRVSPICLKTDSASPVTNDSLTSHSPCRITQSANSWEPLFRMTISSSKTSSTGISSVLPLRSTVAFACETNDSFSTAFFARSS